jgi:methyl-accepting chemotaxis protein
LPGGKSGDIKNKHNTNRMQTAAGDFTSIASQKEAKSGKYEKRSHEIKKISREMEKNSQEMETSSREIKKISCEKKHLLER